MSIRTTRAPFEEIIRTGPYQIRFPAEGEFDQDEEWCEVLIDSKWEKVRFHDYDRIYAIPGLYETLFYRTLRCVSPTEVISLFRRVLEDNDYQIDNLSVLDLGAGNGMAGEALQTMGVRKVVGVDILADAKKAVERDRPWVYNDYFVTDLSQSNSSAFDELRGRGLNTLVTVAALGYGDIPADAFLNAYNLIADHGWIAFNIKEDFLKSSGKSGFSGLINRMLENDIMRYEMYRRYRHRLNIKGEDLYYIALVGRKLKDIPDSMRGL